MSMFENVSRNKAKLRMALTGVAGAGKSLSALYIAYGITGDWSKIAFIDTEHERGRFYADRHDLPFDTGVFLYASLTPPFSPAKYKELVSGAAEAVGSDGVVIVDSFSHAWNAEGGVLDIKDKIAAQGGKNSYTAWNEAGKEQTSLVNSILAVDCHTIVTLRSKMDYILTENDKGKMEPKKIGLQPIQRDDTEYEFDIVLNIARNHVATASKDTTFLDQYGDVITPQLGSDLKLWLDQGLEPVKKATAAQKKELAALVEAKVGKEGVKGAMEKYMDGLGIPNSKAMTVINYDQIKKFIELDLVPEAVPETPAAELDPIPEPEKPAGSETHSVPPLPATLTQKMELAALAETKVGKKQVKELMDEYMKLLSIESSKTMTAPQYFKILKSMEELPPYAEKVKKDKKDKKNEAAETVSE